MEVSAETYNNYSIIDIPNLSSGDIVISSNRPYILRNYKPVLTNNSVFIPEGASNIHATIQFIPATRNFTLNQTVSGNWWTLSNFSINGTSFTSSTSSSVNSSSIRMTNSDIVDVSSAFSTGENIVDFTLNFYKNSADNASSWTYAYNSFGSLYLLYSYDYDKPIDPIPPSDQSPIIYNFNLGSVKSGNFDYHNLTGVGYQSFILSDNFKKDVDFSFSLPEDYTNLSAYLLFKPNTLTPFVSSYGMNPSAFPFGTVFSFDINGSQSQFYVSTNKNTSVTNAYLTEFDYIDISSLLTPGVNTFNSFSFNAYFNYSYFSKSWTFDSDNFGSVSLVVTFDTNSSSIPPSVNIPQQMPEFFSPDHIYFIDTGLDVSDLGLSSLPTTAGHMLDGVYALHSDSILDWGSVSYTSIYSHYVDGQIIYTNNIYLSNSSDILQPFGFDYSPYFNSLSSYLYDIASNIYNLFVELNSLDSNLSNKLDDINTSLNDAGGANDSLNSSNNELNDALQDYKDMTDTSEQFGNIDDSLFDLDTSVFTQLAPTMSLFSSLVSSFWTHVGDFAVPLSLFLICSLVSVIIGIIGRIR